MKFVSPLRILCFTVATLRTPFFICRAACAIDARPPHHMHNGMARSRIARHPIFHMSRDIRIIRISPCEVAQLHTTKQTIRILNTDSQNEVESPPESLNFILGSGNFHGLTSCSLRAVAAAHSDDGRRVHVIHPVGRGAYLGTFSQVHLTPRDNCEKM